ncbi:universal stress protein [Egibacter rhizosphaerae]|uniref:Universal stress protein n=1 Tax=Egibacter rhizosphaerae TaxID=1670831 RepID=A0A411YAU6_9ACTN|nr:universal stress protein [Egibacter rhizosphaerae]QBI18299.1 universal stress protein [Egibacter rhizosphaerae]
MRILVGYLISPEGQAALEAAVAEARLRDAKLVVLHSMRGGTRDEAEQVITYREQLEQIHEQLGAEDIDYEVRELVRGQSPAEDLIEFSAEEDVDLIVIGLRRRSPVGKLVLGSNAQDILLRADCPVLAVKADSEAEGA